MAVLSPEMIATHAAEGGRSGVPETPLVWASMSDFTAIQTMECTAWLNSIHPC